MKESSILLHPFLCQWNSWISSETKDFSPEVNDYVTGKSLSHEQENGKVRKGDGAAQRVKPKSKIPDRE